MIIPDIHLIFDLIFDYYYSFMMTRTILTPDSSKNQIAMSLTFSFVLSVTFFLEKFTRAALTFSESDLLDFPMPQRALWHLISEFGEWRFERKYFRADRETSAAFYRRVSR